MIEIYLSIIGTYLSITFTWFLIELKIVDKKHKKEKSEIILDNQKWKAEVRELLKNK